MKWTFLLLFLSSSLWAKPLVLLSYYDAFGDAPFNNSETIAREVHKLMRDSSVELHLCALNTVFDKSYGQLEDCLKTLQKAPQLVLGLGEAACEMKIEMVGRNLDKTFGPDNEGQERNNSEIIPGAEKFLGFTYPLSEMYCALDAKERNKLVVSNSAGSFVCNNTAYQFSHYYPELASGFIHVPANNCQGLATKNPVVVKNLIKMIKQAVELPSKNTTRLPTTKKEIQQTRLSLPRSESCQQEFFKRARGVDQRGFWTVLN